MGSTVSVWDTVTYSSEMTCARFASRFPLSCSSFSIECQRNEYTGHGRIEIVDCGYRRGVSMSNRRRCGNAGPADLGHLAPRDAHIPTSASSSMTGHGNR